MRLLVLLTETGHFDGAGAARTRDEATDAADMAALERFSDAVEARGEIVAGEALGAPSTARTLRPGDAASRVVTDGPFAETAEQLGGFYLVDLPDLDTAVELARMLPEAFTVEIRPAVDP